MEKVSEIFFSEHGLTSTSASHLADLAQEVIAGNEAKLKNMTFVTTKVDRLPNREKLYVSAMTRICWPRCILFWKT